MESITMKIRRLLQNKDTVTFLGIVLLIIILYFFYSFRVSSQVKTVSVPYANIDIMAGARITSNMISIREVPKAMIGEGVITNPGMIVNRYALGNSVIPQGSLFYEQAVVQEEEATISQELSYPEGFRKYTTTIDTVSTYGNSILPGNYVDIWLSVKPSLNSNKLLIGKLISNVKIISVKDSSGANVFQNLDERLAPAIMNFALPSDCFDLLTATSRLSKSYNAEIKYVPTNESLKEEPDDTYIASDMLKEWVSTHVEYIN